MKWQRTTASALCVPPQRRTASLCHPRPVRWPERSCPRGPSSRRPFCGTQGPRPACLGTVPAAGHNTPDRRSRIRGSSRCSGQGVSSGHASRRYWRRSNPWGDHRMPSRHSRQACRTHPTPSGATPKTHTTSYTARSRRPSYSCARARCGSAPRGRGTSLAHSIWAGSDRPWPQKPARHPISLATLAQLRRFHTGSWDILLKRGPPFGVACSRDA